MNWKELLCPKRPSGEKFEENQELGLSPFERDYYSIVSSSYFRRLQRKAQVYVLDDNDFTRTRLTHSMEVATIAEILGRRIAKRIIDRGEDVPEKFNDDLPMVLRCAGLLHDFGNPPFGHSGEEYIRDYFQENESALKQNLSDQMWLDFINFDGNAHNIRIITKTAKSSNPISQKYGMDLTYAVIASLVKYPYNSLIYNSREEIDGEKPRGKIGYYHSEEWIMTKFVLKDTDTLNKKNPIMLIMEAADDIAYATADIEDAVKKGIIKKEKVIEILNTVVPTTVINNDRRDESDAGSMLKYFREKTMEYVINNFLDNYDDIMTGTYQGELIGNNQNKVCELKALMYGYFGQRDAEAEFKYNSRRKIYDLLDYLIKCVLKEDKTISDKLVLENLNQYLVKNSEEANQTFSANEELYHNYMAVVDFVEGMTDSYVNYFWNKLFSGELVKEAKKTFKEECLKRILGVKNYNQANAVVKDISLVDCWEDYEIAIILKCYISNDQIAGAFESASVIPNLYQIISSCREHFLTPGEIEKLEKLVVRQD